jgi:hypothetical protein
MWEFQISTSKPSIASLSPLLANIGNDQKNSDEDKKNRMKKWLSLEIISQHGDSNNRHVVMSSPVSNNSLDINLKLNDSNTNESKSSSFTQRTCDHKPIAWYKFKSMNDIKANMQNVLNDIKNLDQSRVLVNTDRRTSVPAIKNDIELIMVQSTFDLNDKMVKRLKEKFENKDQTFVKVIILLELF